MPANRSRTLEWRRCLRQICDRNGAIEIAVARSRGNERGTPHDTPRDLVWRVRVLDVREEEIIVEQPSALGQAIPLKQGVALVGILSIGQNRWVFSTANLGETDFAVSESAGFRRVLPAIRLLMPNAVERCQRRSYYRIDTAPGAINLPAVEVWPLLDAQSVVLAERAAEMQLHFNTGEGEEHAPKNAAQESPSLNIMPEVGPGFTATLLNIGGGGVGLLIEPGDAHVLARHRLLWLRFSLPPELHASICATARVVHSHMESSQQVYVGIAFDFSFNPAHQRCVVDQICRFIALQQREQLQRMQETDEIRRSA